MTAFARQLRGRLAVELDAQGMVSRLTFPRPEIVDDQDLRHPFGNQTTG